MKALTEADLRASFVNASRREAGEAGAPDLESVRWSEIDYLGWRNPKLPLLAYVAMTLPEDPETPVGVILRSVPKGERRRRMLCAWCQDIVSKNDVVMYIAKRAGASGRRGNTLGTAICTDFGCSANARRLPSLAEMSKDASQDEKDFWIGLRVEDLRRRSAHFVREVRDSA
jgi:hypothetical protein